MNLIAQTLADGLVLGGIYALAAVGFSLIFGVLHVINLSHGILVLIGAYLALIISQALKVDPLLTLPLVMAALFAIGYVYQRFLIQRAVDRSPLGSMLLTFGVALMLQNIMIWVFSPDMKNITPSWAFTSFHLGAVNFDAVRVSALFASLVLLCCLALLLKFSPLGRVIEIAGQSVLDTKIIPDLAEALGCSGWGRPNIGLSWSSWCCPIPMRPLTMSPGPRSRPAGGKGGLSDRGERARVR